MIQIDNLCKLYRGDHGEEVRALDDVSLTISAGRCLLLTGPSGSGKTTLLSLIGALSRPTSGSIVLEGRELHACSDVELARIRRKIGFVFQNFSLLPRLPVWENVTYPLVPRGIRRSARYEIARRVLQRLDLATKMESRSDRLSGGEQQRVAVARALAGEPRVLVADEPTSNLDDGAAAELTEIFREIHAAGITLIVASHSAKFLELATDTCKLHEGKVTCP